MDSLNFGAKSYQITCPEFPLKTNLLERVPVLHSGKNWEFPLECDLKGSYAVKLTTVQLPSRCRLVL